MKSAAYQSARYLELRTAELCVYASCGAPTGGAVYCRCHAATIAAYKRNRRAQEPARARARSSRRLVMPLRRVDAIRASAARLGMVRS